MAHGLLDHAESFLTHDNMLRQTAAMATLSIQSPCESSSPSPTPVATWHGPLRRQRRDGRAFDWTRPFLSSGCRAEPHEGPNTTLAAMQLSPSSRFSTAASLIMQITVAGDHCLARLTILSVHCGCLSLLCQSGRFYWVLGFGPHLDEPLPYLCSPPILKPKASLSLSELTCGVGHISKPTLSSWSRDRTSRWMDSRQSSGGGGGGGGEGRGEEVRACCRKDRNIRMDAAFHS